MIRNFYVQVETIEEDAADDSNEKNLSFSVGVRLLDQYFDDPDHQSPMSFSSGDTIGSTFESAVLAELFDKA
jgi:hypothetical protein